MFQVQEDLVRLKDQLLLTQADKGIDLSSIQNAIEKAESNIQVLHPLNMLLVFSTHLWCLTSARVAEAVSPSTDSLHLLQVQTETVLNKINNQVQTLPALEEQIIGDTGVLLETTWDLQASQGLMPSSADKSIAPARLSNKYVADIHILYKR